MLKLTPQGHVPSVNENSKNTDPGGVIDKTGHIIMRLINGFAESPEGDKIFQGKWDIKDGFWRLYCKEREEWNF